jgi:DNA-binding MarR family transcriptional regulator
MSADLPRSAIIILDHLSSAGPMSPKQIADSARLPSRTVSFALKKLMKQSLCKKVPNLLDMRQPLYHVNDERLRDLSAHIDKIRAEAGIHLRAV